MKWKVLFLLVLGALALVVFKVAAVDPPSYQIDKEIATIDPATGERRVQESIVIRVYTDGTRREDGTIYTPVLRHSSTLTRPDGSMYSWVPDLKVMVNGLFPEGRLRHVTGSQRAVKNCDPPIGEGPAVREETFLGHRVEVFALSEKVGDSDVYIESWRIPALGCEEALFSTRNSQNGEVVGMGEARAIRITGPLVSTAEEMNPPRGYEQVAPSEVERRAVEKYGFPAPGAMCVRSMERRDANWRKFPRAVVP